MEVAGKTSLSALLRAYLVEFCESDPCPRVKGHHGNPWASHLPVLHQPPLASPVAGMRHWPLPSSSAHSLCTLLPFFLTPLMPLYTHGATGRGGDKSVVMKGLDP